jgi:hypothetical protein
MKLSKNNLSTILDIIDTFKNKKSVKELVLLKYANVPIYATIFCSDIERLLDWMMPQFLETEDYESCKRITDIKKIINKK